MQRPVRSCLLLAVSAALCFGAASACAHDADTLAAAARSRETREIRGWRVHIDQRLLETKAEATARALDLLEGQLRDLVDLVPAAAVEKLRRVPLYVSPSYPGSPPRAEYHPGADWLRENGRDPVMVKAVEFTNVDDFEAECRRMPALVLHELAHAYHDRELPGGHDNETVREAYERARASGRYDKVERRDSEGNTAFDRAYALTNPAEYFAETTEAFFSTNDFFPYDREELERVDPHACEMLATLWGVADESPNTAEDAADAVDDGVASGVAAIRVDSANPWYPHRDFPRLPTPEWIGEEGVEAVIVLAIDDMRDPAVYETALRPVIDRLKQLDGQAGVSIMTNAVPPDDPLLGRWLSEGLSLECHTADHPCPLLGGGDFAKAKSTFDRCVDAMAAIPGNRPVAFRMPCCDSLNTVSPRFFAEIFSRRTPEGRALEIDSSVFMAFTSDDPSLPRDLVLDADGRERFLKYVPVGHRYAGQVHDHFVNLIRDYPYPYPVDGTCWEIPCLVPSDWSAQHLHGVNNQQTVDDWKAAVDLTVLKQGCVSLVFHPHGWIRPEQIVELIDHTVATHGTRVRFLSFAEVARRLAAAYTDGRPLREQPPAFLAAWHAAREQAGGMLAGLGDQERQAVAKALAAPQAYGLPAVQRPDGSHNGCFVAEGHLCWANEDTAVRPDFLERVAIAEVVERVGTRDAAAALPAVSRGAAAPIKAAVPIGAAVVDITPEEPVRLTGYAARTSDTGEVAARIHARALAIGPAEDLTAVLLSVDNCGIPRSLAERVYARVAADGGLPRERFAVLATHTHSAPWLRDFAPNIFPDLPADSAERLDRYERALEEKLVEVCREAIASQRPGRLSLAYGEVGFAVNRRAVQDGRWVGFGENPEGPVDHRLPVLAAREESGELIALLANYACHCTTEPGSFNQISGDWAGCAADMLEAGHAGCVALMAIGCGADANPSPGGTHELSRAHGHSLAAEVNRLLETPAAWRPLDPEVVCRLESIDLPLAALPSRDAWQVAAAGGGVEGARARFFLEMLDRGEELPRTVSEYPVQTWCFGDDLAMVFLAGEVVVDYALRLGEMFDRDRLWVNAYANDVPCYIASARLLREGGYEVDSSMLYYRQPTRLAPEAEDLICDAVQKLLPHAYYSASLQEAFPGPKDPAAAVASMVARPGMKVLLAAAEPLIRDPVAFDWDEQGRLYVAEMSDYPVASDGRTGRVRLLTDTDRDGVYDEAETFLDGLAYPTGVHCWRDGVIVSMAPDVIYAEDTDGDGAADLRETLISGFSEGNQQHRVNGLRLDLDGRLALANGDSGGIVSASGYVPGGKRREASGSLPLRGRDLWFDVETATIEAASGTTQFSRSRDDFGTWFGNNNANPIWQYVFEDRYLRRNPHAGAISAVAQVAAVPGTAPVYPVSRTLDRFNDFALANRFTSACGTIIYRDQLLGEGFVGNAFIAEPVHNLVSRLVMQPTADGLGFLGERAADEQDREFLASQDNWFRPTMLRTGPDGAVWVADMYRAVIEHPEWIPEEYRRKLDLAAGSDRGRIYRVVPDDGCCEPAGGPMRTFFSMPWREIPLADLAARLQSPSGWWRDLAERILLHRRDEVLASPELLAAISERAAAPGAVGVQAVATLAALARGEPHEAIDRVIREAAASGDPRVRRVAVRCAEPALARGDAAMLSALEPLAADPDAAVRRQLLLSLGEAGDPAAARLLGTTLAGSAAEPSLVMAGLTSLRPETIQDVVAAVVTMGEQTGGDASAAEASARLALVGQLLAQASAMGRDGSLGSVTAQLLATVTPDATAEALALATSLMRSGSPDAEVEAARERTVAAAWQIARDPQAADERRAAAVRLLEAAGASLSDPMVVDTVLSPQSGPAAQAACAEAVAKRGNAATIGRLLGRLAELSPNVRGILLSGLLGRPQTAAMLLERLGEGSLVPADLDAAQRDRLLSYPDDAIASRAAELLSGSAGSGRADVVARWEELLAGLAGDAARGAAVFEKRCGVCHRLQEIGRAVGPDLAALTDRSRPALVAAILDPNRAVETKYLSYTLLSTDGRIHAGMLEEETGAGVTLVAADGQRQAVPRAEIESLTASGRSLMPEGLEQDLTPQDLADVIAFVQSSGVRWKQFAGNEPRVVAAGDDGTIRLPASAAEIYGPSLVYEPQHGNLGWWSSVDDHARWTVEVPRGDDWIVEVDYACDDSAAGGMIRFSTGTRMLTARVPGTGSWDSYQTWRVGALDIFGGTQQITVTAVEPPQSALIDIRAIRLLPPK